MGVSNKLSKVPDSISEEIIEDAIIADMTIPNARTTSPKVNNISPWSNRLSSLSVSSRYATRLKIRDAEIIHPLARQE